MPRSTCDAACHATPSESRTRSANLAAIIGAAAGLAATAGFLIATADARDASAVPAASASAAGMMSAEPMSVPGAPGPAAEQALRKGDEAPDVTFTNADGETVRLSELYAEKPTVVVYYRGSWCGFCSGSLRKFEKARGDIEAAGGHIVGITPEKTEFLEPNVEKNKLGYDLLADPGLRAGREFGIAWRNERYKHLPKYNGEGSFEIPLGVTYIIGTDGKIA
ncbi:MAG: peroxiredoxin-like family protein, partial [Planctomycetota bacterium]